MMVKIFPKWPLLLQRFLVYFNKIILKSSLVAQTVKCLPTIWETWVQSLDQEDPLEKDITTHSSTLAWKIPQTEEPGRLQSMGSQRVGYDWATSVPYLTLKSLTPQVKRLKIMSQSQWFCLSCYHNQETKKPHLLNDCWPWENCSLVSPTNHSQTGKHFSVHTRFSFVSDVLKFCIEDGFLKHSQKDDSTDPKLNSQEISPIASRPCQPQNTKQDIYNTHHHEKLSSKWVKEKKKD